MAKDRRFGRLWKWHAIVTFRKPKPPPTYCGSFLKAPSLRLDPHGEAKSLLDKLFHPAKIQ